MADRTFKLDTPHMRGSDIEAWQQFLHDRFRGWNIDYPVTVDGDYGQATRAASVAFFRAWGAESGEAIVGDGIQPKDRIRARNDQRTDAEQERFESDERKAYRAALREKYDGGGVAMPLAKILADSWGWAPASGANAGKVHDGIDLICPPHSPIFAICEGVIVRADTGGWWGKAPSGDVSKGDGIVILRSLVNAGPIRKGMNICYGHAERPKVREGQRVSAGDVLGEAGLAVAWHVHWMINDNKDTRGVGDRDPRPVLDYCRRNA